MNVRTKKVLTMIGCILVPQALGMLSSLLAGDMRSMYENLNKPPFSPPGGLFGIVWPIMYLLMGIASYFIITSFVPTGEKALKKKAIALYVAQLLLNFVWSIIFFGGDMFWFAFVVIIALDVLVIMCIITFNKIYRLSAVFMAIYMLWLLFATYLNVAFAILN